MLQHSVTSTAGGDSVFSRAWSDVSQVNPERDKISNFDGNNFIIQNLNFNRQQYEQAFRFREPHPTTQIICNNIDDGDVLSQQYLQWVIADSSVPVVEPLQTTSGGASNQVVSTIIDDGDPLYQQYLQRVIAESSVVARKMHGPDRQTLLAGAREQRNEAGFQAYLQRYSNLHSPSSQNPKLYTSGPDYELKSTLAIAPHSEDLREQHPVWTSAANLTAPRFKLEEAGNMEINCCHVNRLQSSLPTSSPEFKFGANSSSPGFQFGVAVSTSYVASQLHPVRDKIFNSPENNFLQQNSECKTSSPIFAFGESLVARTALEFLPGKGLCSNPHPLFGVDGTVEHPHEDYERAASLERHAFSASENFQDSALEYSATAVTPPSLQNCVGGNPAIFHFPTSISLGFQFGKSARALNPVPPIQFREPQITPALIDIEKCVADNYHCRLHSPDADRESGSEPDLRFVAGEY